MERRWETKGEALNMRYRLRTLRHLMSVAMMGIEQGAGGPLE
jgi:hypothetical protein